MENDSVKMYKVLCDDQDKDKIHNIYEKDECVNAFDDPNFILNSLKEHQLVAEYLFKNYGDVNIQIADLGCGAGISGEELKKVGYQNVHAFDFSNKMIQRCKEKNCYRTATQCELGANKFPDEHKGKYDIALAWGLVLTNHVNAEVFDDFIACLSETSKYRHIVFNIFQEKNKSDQFWKKIDELTKMGKVKVIEKIPLKHREGKDVLPSFMMNLQVIV